MIRECPNCKRLFKRKFSNHLLSCAGLTDQEYTNLSLFGDKDFIPKCVICGKSAYYNKGHYEYYSTCKSGNCAKILSNMTKLNNNTHNFLKGNRLLLPDGRDRISVIANRTKVLNNSHNFQRDNRLFEGKRILTNLKKYGTISPTNFWYRTDYNNGLEFLISDEELINHNNSVTDNRRANQLNNLTGYYRSDCELYIESLLINSKYDYISQYHDSSWDRSYVSDFYIPNYNLIIEVDGDWKLIDGEFLEYYKYKYNYIINHGHKLLNIMQSDSYNYDVNKLEELIELTIQS